MIPTVTLNPAVDQTMRFEDPLSAETVNRSTVSRFDAGGKGINVSQFLTALGTETVASGTVGGFTGQFLREALHDDGVETDFVEVEAPTRLNSTILAAGTEYKLNQHGPEVPPSVADDIVDRIAARDPDRAMVGGSLPPGLNIDAVDQIADAGSWQTVVDVKGELLRELSADYALCKPNRDELAGATDRPVETVEECVAAARKLRKAGFERVVASLGADGAVLVGPDGAVYADPLDVDVADTVGAGDAMLTGVLAALERGDSDETALATGTAVAARVVAQSGTGTPEFDGVFEDRTNVDVRTL